MSVLIDCSQLSADQVYNYCNQNAYFLTEVYPDFWDINPIQLTRVAVAICKQESNFQPCIENGVGAIGLMQVHATNPATQNEIETKILWFPKRPGYYLKDPEYNTLVGMAYLCYQYVRNGNNWDKAIFAYNQGSYNGKANGFTYLTNVQNKMKDIDYSNLESTFSQSLAMLSTTYPEFP